MPWFYPVVLVLRCEGIFNLESGLDQIKNPMKKSCVFLLNTVPTLLLA